MTAKLFEWKEFPPTASVFHKHAVLVEFVKHDGQLFESNSQDDVDYFGTLSHMSDKLISGHKYLVIGIALSSGNIMPICQPTFVTFVGQSVAKNINTFKIKYDDGSITEFPSKWLSAAMPIVTCLFNNEASYDEFRAVMALKYDHHLEDFNSYDSKLTEESLAQILKLSGLKK